MNVVQVRSSIRISLFVVVMVVVLVVVFCLAMVLEIGPVFGTIFGANSGFKSRCFNCIIQALPSKSLRKLQVKIFWKLGEQCALLRCDFSKNGCRCEWGPEKRKQVCPACAGLHVLTLYSILLPVLHTHVLSKVVPRSACLSHTKLSELHELHCCLRLYALKKLKACWSSTRPGGWTELRAHWSFLFLEKVRFSTGHDSIDHVCLWWIYEFQQETCGFGCFETTCAIPLIMSAICGVCLKSSGTSGLWITVFLGGIQIHAKWELVSFAFFLWLVLYFLPCSSNSRNCDFHIWNKSTYLCGSHCGSGAVAMTC